MKPDMSPQAVTKRLRQTGELRKLCLALGRRRSPACEKTGEVPSKKRARRSAQ